jgi:hypothetical protein
MFHFPNLSIFIQYYKISFFIFIISYSYILFKDHISMRVFIMNDYLFHNLDLFIRTLSETNDYGINLLYIRFGTQYLLFNFLLLLTTHFL